MILVEKVPCSPVVPTSYKYNPEKGALFCSQKATQTHQKPLYQQILSVNGLSRCPKSEKKYIYENPLTPSNQKQRTKRRERENRAGNRTLIRPSPELIAKKSEPGLNEVRRSLLLGEAIIIVM